MTSYVPVLDAVLAIGKPFTSVLAKILRDNSLAMFEGNSAAPKLWQQARRYIDIIASGTFEVPQGCTLIFVEMVGGGGGGAFGPNSGYQCGGANGGYAAGCLTVTPGALIPATIGAGGLGGVNIDNATSGGTTSFGSLMSATGGLRGRMSTIEIADFEEMYNLQMLCRGGAGVGGDWNDVGAAGMINHANTSPSAFAEGGRGRGGIGGNISGSNAIYYGEGGRGGAWNGSNGLAGKSGFVRVWY